MVRPACPAAAVSGATATVTCRCTGAAQYWTVPARVSQATLTRYGAAGGTSGDSGTSGTGAEVTGTLPVTPGTVLHVNVGQAGALNSALLAGTASAGGGRAAQIHASVSSLAVERGTFRDR